MSQDKSLSKFSLSNSSDIEKNNINIIKEFVTQAKLPTEILPACESLLDAKSSYTDLVNAFNIFQSYNIEVSTLEKLIAEYLGTGIFFEQIWPNIAVKTFKELTDKITLLYNKNGINLNAKKLRINISEADKKNLQGFIYNERLDPKIHATIQDLSFSFDNNALTCSIAYAHFNITDFLIALDKDSKKLRVAEADGLGRTPLILCSAMATLQATNIAMKLIDIYGEDLALKQRDKFNMHALDYAILTCNLPLTKKLLTTNQFSSEEISISFNHYDKEMTIEQKEEVIRSLLTSFLIKPDRASNAQYNVIYGENLCRFYLKVNGEPLSIICDPNISSNISVTFMLAQLANNDMVKNLILNPPPKGKLFEYINTQIQSFNKNLSLVQQLLSQRSNLQVLIQDRRIQVAILSSSASKNAKFPYQVPSGSLNFFTIIKEYITTFKEDFKKEEEKISSSNNFTK